HGLHKSIAKSLQIRGQLIAGVVVPSHGDGLSIRSVSQLEFVTESIGRGYVESRLVPAARLNLRECFANRLQLTEVQRSRTAFAHILDISFLIAVVTVGTN